MSFYDTPEVADSGELAMGTEIITPVVFRVYPDGDVLAMFPTVPADDTGWNCGCYMHPGLRGGADYRHVIHQTRPADPAEYNDLKAELESRGYQLKVYHRAQPCHHVQRMEAVRSYA